MGNVRRSWSFVVLVALGVLIASMPAARAGDALAWPALEKGNRDGKGESAVHALQYLLKEHGFNASANGSYNGQTEKQVRSFQKQNGLTQDGKMSELTWLKLIVKTNIGEKGDGVRAVQYCLKAAGLDVKVDGDFGAQTDSALKKFQQDNNIVADGLVGRNTWNFLVNVGRLKN